MNKLYSPGYPATILTFICVFLTVQLKAQLASDWTPSSKSGNIIISGTQPTNTAYDVDITRTSSNSGIKIFNQSLTGRSLLLFGQGYGGKYGYLAHHSDSHVSDPGYTQTYRPASTVLTGADINGLGIVSAQDIRFSSGGAEDVRLRMTISANGNVGIGAISPVAKLQIGGSVYSGASRTNTIFNGNINDQAANFIGSEGYWGIRTGTNNSFNLDVYNGNNPIVALTTLQNGNVGIGTTSPGSFKLAVEGKIGAREVNVTTAAWSDYVFKSEYRLRSLTEVDQYIKENQHLPDVPSEKEVLKNGQDLGAMNSILLRKIEELTLYVIELNKIVARQNERIGEFENKK
jgi:hypothetical protein